MGFPVVLHLEAALKQTAQHLFQFRLQHLRGFGDTVCGIVTGTSLARMSKCFFVQPLGSPCQRFIVVEVDIPGETDVRSNRDGPPVELIAMRRELHHFIRL